MLIVVLSTLVFASQNRATGLRDDGHLISTVTWHSPASPDSCNFKLYKYDDGKAEDAFTYTAPGTLVRIGNFFLIADSISGVIKSVKMYFSSYSRDSAQSCIVYFYKADQTTIFGQSPAFINTGAPWPADTCITVTCPDIPYTGPFYAMVDYTITTLPYKNYFDVDLTSTFPGFPLGLGFADINGVWNIAGYDWLVGSSTFLQRVNVCENGVVGIEELSPGSISLYPNPANDFVNIVSSDNIMTIEVLNFTGQTIYKTNDVDLKGTKLDVASFRTGEYMVKITTMNGIETKKITVIH